MSNSKVQFPAKEYSNVQKEWIGKEYIVTPSILNILVDGGIIKDKNVIDIGCGNGHYSNDMLKWEAKSVHGIDQSIEMINKAKNTYTKKGLTFECISTLDMKYEEIYDVAVAFFVMEFNQTIDDLFKSFKNIQKCLKKGGKFISIIPNGIQNYNSTKEEGQKFGASWEINLSTKRYDGERLKINFYNKNGEVIGNSPVTFYFNETYINAALSVGFTSVEFKNVIISEDGIKKYGKEFFNSFINPPKIVFLIETN
ncbi:Methyltransferase domain-containing protein [Strongyloides ratti]|uniref:Methyltransferase domain-containing protein n=1 Tax=Strongyloides ratti TaxID=34506 RepID=A0A090L6D0_STRRB|nr:Methyltransferase domain-containing protein [Strongyloides ratti]CEF65282.1 Methyltransferase domain-containing protein [Strongyloides ratti]